MKNFLETDLLQMIVDPNRTTPFYTVVTFFIRHFVIFQSTISCFLSMKMIAPLREKWVRNLANEECVEICLANSCNAVSPNGFVTVFITIRLEITDLLPVQKCSEKHD